MQRNHSGTYGVCSHRVLKRGDNFYIARNDIPLRNGRELVEQIGTSFSQSSLSRSFKYQEIENENVLENEKEQKKSTPIDDLIYDCLKTNRPNRISIFGVFQNNERIGRRPKSNHDDFDRTKMLSLKDLPNPNLHSFAKPKSFDALFRSNSRRKDAFAEHYREVKRRTEKMFPQWSNSAKTGESFHILPAFGSTIQSSKKFYVNPKYSNVIQRDPCTNKLLVAPSFRTMMNNVSFNLPEGSPFTEQQQQQYQKISSPYFTESENPKRFKFDLSSAENGMFFTQKRDKTENQFFNVSSSAQPVRLSNEEWTFAKPPPIQKIVWKNPPAPKFWFETE